jgi:phospholipase/carboxylesterase
MLVPEQGALAMTIPLDGPRRKPASGGRATSLIVLLHGLGADGDDLIELAGPFGQMLPDAAFVAPNAPERCDMAAFGHQWFSVQDRTPANAAAGADRAAPPLLGFIEAELAARGLDVSRLALVGFSQGSMMALHVGLRMDPAPAAIVGFSGMLVAPERLAAERRGKPPVLLVHGTADEVVPFTMMGLAAAALHKAGVEPETLACPGLGHGIDEPGMIAAATFLERHLMP